MTPYEIIIGQNREAGRLDALDLRARASDLDGTGIVAEERKAPVFDPNKDYSDWPAGSPVRELVDGGYQVFKLLQPHHAGHYPDTSPSTLPALWSVCHTTDPAKAKPYMPPNGTGGMYMTGECCTENGRVYRSLVDNGAFAPSAYAANWEDLGEVAAYG